MVGLPFNGESDVTMAPDMTVSASTVEIYARTGRMSEPEESLAEV